MWEAIKCGVKGYAWRLRNENELLCTGWTAGERRNAEKQADSCRERIESVRTGRVKTLTNHRTPGTGLRSPLNL